MSILTHQKNLQCRLDIAGARVFGKSYYVDRPPLPNLARFARLIVKPPNYEIILHQTNNNCSSVHPKHEEQESKMQIKLPFFKLEG